MAIARTYSVTPRTVCFRTEDGKRHIMLFASPKKDGVWGYAKGGSFSHEGKWVRTYEHPQEWSDCG
jgi:hypothetical protein